MLLRCFVCFVPGSSRDASGFLCPLWYTDFSAMRFDSSCGHLITKKYERKNFLCNPDCYRNSNLDDRDTSMGVLWVYYWRVCSTCACAKRLLCKIELVLTHFWNFWRGSFPRVGSMFNPKNQKSYEN